MYANFKAMMEGLELLALVAGGFAAGLINVIAGNGYAITLPLLMWVGLDANTANATNRVGAIFQTVSAMGSLPKSKRVKYLFKESYFIIPPIVIGAIAGSLLAVDIPEDLMRVSIGILMIVLLATMLLNPKKWLIQTDGSKQKKTVGIWLSFLILGLYGGFIQMGFGIFFLSVAVLQAKYALRDGNIMKLFIALIMTIPSFLIFAASGSIEWTYGGALAIGTALGARFGARKVMQHPRINAIIRYVLIAVILVAIEKMFEPYLVGLF
jgi:uncharacterized membrane protein YfcA